MIRRTTTLLVFLAMLAGCAGQGTYDPITDRAFRGPRLAAVLDEPGRHDGARVRWGGEIAGVENRADETLIELVAHELGRGGRPRDTDYSAGRFIARVRGFLDPAVYRTGRALTVVGSIAGTRQGSIGEHPYRFPVVDVTDFRLWREEVRYRHGHPFDYYWDEYFLFPRHFPHHPYYRWP